jgi:hypothetical protein
MTLHDPAAFRLSDPAPFGPPSQHPGAPLVVELRRPAGLPRQERGRWAELSGRATPGNIFAQDWFMEPALRHCGTAWSVHLAIVRREPGEWLGVLPLRLGIGIAGWPAPIWQSWRAASQPIGTPLVLPGAERAFWQALLAQLDRQPGLALGLCCGALPVESAAALALTDLCAEQGRMLHVCDRFSRPARLPAAAPAPTAAPTAAADVRKLDARLDALEARLAAALGPVSFVLHDSGEDCEPWLAAYFALERAGWKGRTGRALACNPAAAAQFREVIRNGQRGGTVRLASLCAGERIVAMTCWFVGGAHGYGYAITHDEDWDGFDPERLLLRRVARMIDKTPRLLFDSCAAPGTPSDAFWPDRRSFGSLAVGIGSAKRRALFDALMRRRT